MKMNVYSVFDSASKSFMRPMFMSTDGQAIRVFQDEANNNKTLIYAHPDQFTLFKIGEFDDNDGELVSIGSPVSLGNAIQYRTVSTDISERLSMIYEDLRKFYGDK